jgi:hypothetical protein
MWWWLCVIAAAVLLLSVNVCVHGQPYEDDWTAVRCELHSDCESEVEYCAQSNSGSECAPLELCVRLNDATDCQCPRTSSAVESECPGGHCLADTVAAPACYVDEPAWNDGTAPDGLKCVGPYFESQEGACRKRSFGHAMRVCDSHADCGVKEYCVE